MENHSRQPLVLHLAGITLADYVPIEDVFDEKVLERAEKEEVLPEPLPFDKIPPVFTSLEEWPLSTNLRCWACPFTFDGPPRFAPPYIRPGEDGRTEVGVEGNFCTFNCAANYIDVTYPPQAYPEKHWRMRDNLCHVYFMFTGQRVLHIEAAPPKIDLQEYGGDLSEEQFWERLRKLDPKHGLRDHRLGTILSERLRPTPPSGPPPVGRPVWSACFGPGEEPGEDLGEEPAAAPSGRPAVARRKNNVGTIEEPALSSEEMARELEAAPPPGGDMDLLLEELYDL